MSILDQCFCKQQVCRGNIKRKTTAKNNVNKQVSYANEKIKQQTNRIIILFIYLLQKLVERLSTMKLVVSNKTALKKLDSYGVNFDGPLKEM